MLSSWDVPPEKVHAFVHDGGSNYQAAFRDHLPYSDSNCSAHKINLVVRNSPFNDSEAKAILDRTRKVVGHFKHSTLACDKLKKAQEEEELLSHKFIQVTTSNHISILNSNI